MTPYVSLFDRIIKYVCTYLWITGPVASNHVNLYTTLLALVLGCYGVPHAEVNGTE